MQCCLKELLPGVAKKRRAGGSRKGREEARQRVILSEVLALGWIPRAALEAKSHPKSLPQIQARQMGFQRSTSWSLAGFPFTGPKSPGASAFCTVREAVSEAERAEKAHGTDTAEGMDHWPKHLSSSAEPGFAECNWAVNQLDNLMMLMAGCSHF